VSFLKDLSDAIADPKKCEEAAMLQMECAEFASDVLLACYAKKWANLPTPIVKKAQARLSVAQQKVMFT
jgi:hypothetical protein